jgi:hypothetical protein
MIAAVEREPLDDTCETQAVIPVKMRDADVMNAARRDICQNQLPLHPFARIKQKTFSIPTKQIGVMAALSRGRLTAGSEGN